MEQKLIIEKERIIKAFNSAKQRLECIIKLRAKQEAPVGEFKYNPLTPIDDAKNGEYDNALLQALSNPYVTNIAVTGHYGSGKSSVLKTFEKNHSNRKEFKFLSISLATFDKLVSNDKTELDIEKSLLQQIIFKVKSTTLKDSNFSRIKISNWKRNLFLALFLAELALVTAYLINKDYEIFQLEIFKNNYFFSDSNLWMLFTFAFFSYASLMQVILNSLPKLGVSKLGLASAEVIFNDKKNDSLLNKHLDELIYFFTETRFNVVILEDLDRFKNKDIFIKLREINLLLNNSDELLSRKLKVRFIYALGDDVLDSINRTKFFDFILPVIPVVSSSNAAEVLKKDILSVAGVNPKSIPASFFDSISLYIDDKRLLLNIANEFNVYKTKLGEVSGIDLKDIKLLSMIIYKNKYPKDFVRLNSRTGMLVSVFDNKKSFVDKRLDSLKGEIHTLKEEVKKIEDEKLISLDELKRIYVYEYLKLLPAGSHLSFDRRNIISNEQLLTDESFDQLIAAKKIYAYKQSYEVTDIPVNFKEIEEAVDGTKSFKERLEIVSDKVGAKAKRNAEEIKSKTEEMSVLKRQSFKTLIERFPNEKFYELKQDVTENEDIGLIKYLTSNGFIDEDYMSFISFFYEGDLSKNDKQFMINIAQNESTDFDFKLQRPAVVTEKLLNQEIFTNPKILNFDLFEFLFKVKTKMKERNLAINSLLNANTDGYRFTCTFIVNTAYPQDFIEEITNVKPEYFEELFESDFLEIDAKQNALASFLINASSDSLDKANARGFFTDHLSTSENAFDIFEAIALDVTCKLIEILNLKFENLTYCKDSSLIEYIHKASAYKITDHNIEFILETLADSQNKKANYASIVESGLTELNRYINENINEYVGNVWVDLDTQGDEAESAVILLLNNEEILNTSVELILDGWTKKLSLLSSIDDKDFWQKILEKNKVVSTWGNVLLYWNFIQYKFDDTLLSFLGNEKNYQELSKSKIQGDKEGVQKISVAIIYKEDFKDEAYRALTKSVPFYYTDLSGIKVSESKVEILLRNNIFGLTAKNFQFLINTFEDIAYLLIEYRFKDYLGSNEDYPLNTNIISNLLDSTIVDTKQKNRFLKIVAHDITTADDTFINQFSDWYLKNIKKIKISPDIKNVMLLTSGGYETKVKIFNANSTELDRSTIIEFIGVHPKLSALKQRQHVKLELNSDSKDFADCLVSQGLVKANVEKNTIRLRPNPILYS